MPARTTAVVVTKGPIPVAIALLDADPDYAAAWRDAFNEEHGGELQAHVVRNFTHPKNGQTARKTDQKRISFALRDGILWRPEWDKAGHFPGFRR